MFGQLCGGYSSVARPGGESANSSEELSDVLEDWERQLNGINLDLFADDSSAANPDLGGPQS